MRPVWAPHRALAGVDVVKGDNPRQHRVAESHVQSDKGRGLHFPRELLSCIDHERAPTNVTNVTSGTATPKRWRTVRSERHIQDTTGHRDTNTSIGVFGEFTWPPQRS
jgi:hypothetical protein